MISVYFILFVLSLITLLFTKGKSTKYKALVFIGTFLALSGTATAIVISIGDPPPENSRIIQLQ